MTVHNKVCGLSCTKQSRQMDRTTRKKNVILMLMMSLWQAHTVHAPFFTHLPHVQRQQLHAHRHGDEIRHTRREHLRKHTYNTNLNVQSNTYNLSHPHCCSNLLLFQKIRSKLVKLSRQLWPRWELEKEEIPLSRLPKEGFLPHCRLVESKGCGVYLESCWCGNFWLWNNAALSKEG